MAKKLPKNTSSIHDKAKKFRETSKEKNSGFPCPVCNSYETRVKGTPVSDNWPIVYGTGMMPHYMRVRECKECGTTWKTCESIVVDSIEKAAIKDDSTSTRK